MVPALHQHPIDVPAAAFAFEPNGRLGLGELAQVPDDAVIACRTNERALSPIVDKDPVFFFSDRKAG
jgi:hypothetical protein